MKNLKKLIDDEAAEKETAWLCDDCFGGRQYLGQIWGSPSKPCGICGKVTALKKYKWRVNSPKQGSLL